MTAIHQLVAGFTKGDAISNEVVALRAIFRSWGYKSEIFCETHRVLPQLRAQTHDAALAREMIHPGDIAVLHLSIGSTVNDIFAGLNCKRALIYHNITPARFFRGIQEEIARDLAWGREQAKSLANTAEVSLAVSRFNARELEAMGYDRVSILPIILNFSRLRSRPDRGIVRAMADGKTNVLFVGRGAPNKRIEDLLCAFHFFQKTIEPNSRLVHVGSYTGLERYQALAQALVRRLNIQNMIFAGNVSQEELNAYYKSAHLFVGMSEHEGFCIPLIESMAHDLPILAYEAGAVPETLDGAGVMFTEKVWDWVAELMGKMAKDNDLRAQVMAKQRDRLKRYETNNLAAELKGYLAPLLPD